MDSSNPFSFKWSLKRSSTGNTKVSSYSLANQSYAQFQNEKSNDFHQRNMHRPIAVQQDNHNGEPEFHKGTIDQIQEIQESMLSQLHISQKGEPLQRNDESATAAKKMKVGERKSSSLIAMDVDGSSSEKAVSNTDSSVCFEEGLEELKNIEGKYSEWLSGQWLPSKEDALQLLMHSKILQQRFQAIVKDIEQEGKMADILEMSSMLVESIKGSIVECDTCSLELMDYSSGKEVPQQITAALSEIENGETDLTNWTAYSKNDKDKSEEYVTDKKKELNTSANLNSGAVGDEGFQQKNNSITDNAFFQESSVLRVKKVRKIRALLLPKILDMLDNFDQWSEKHLDKTMQEFLETKLEETLHEKSSVDDTVEFVVRGSV